MLRRASCAPGCAAAEVHLHLHMRHAGRSGNPKRKACLTWRVASRSVFLVDTPQPPKSLISQSPTTDIKPCKYQTPSAYALFILSVHWLSVPAKYRDMLAVPRPDPRAVGRCSLQLAPSRRSRPPIHDGPWQSHCRPGCRPTCVFVCVSNGSCWRTVCDRSVLQHLAAHATCPGVRSDVPAARVRGEETASSGGNQSIRTPAQSRRSRRAAQRADTNQSWIQVAACIQRIMLPRLSAQWLVLADPSHPPLPQPPHPPWQEYV